MLRQSSSRNDNSSLSTNGSTSQIQQQQQQQQQQYHDIDTYYETAYQSTNSSSQASCRFRYWIIFLAMGIANSGDATEIGSMSFCLANEGFKEEILGGDLKTRGAMLAGAIFFGMLVGGIVTGAYGDRLGRRPTLLTGLIINTISGFSAALAPDFLTLSIIRFTSGLGIGAILSSLIALATESSPPSQRGFYVTFVASFWTLGMIFVAVLAWAQLGYYERSWRVFVATCAVPCALGYATVFLFIPESARYLALHGRLREAADAANVIADDMGYKGRKLTSEELSRSFAGSRRREGDDEEAMKTMIVPMVPRKGFREMSRDAMRNIQNLYVPSLCNRTLKLQLLWFLLSFGSGLCTWINAIFTQINVSDMYVHALFFSLANIPGNIFAGLLMDHMSRKVFLGGSLAATSTSLLLFAFAASDAKYAPFVLGSACIFHAFLVCSWCAVNVFTSEQFPTEVRGSGMGVCAASGRVAAMMVQYVNGALVERPSLLLMVASVALALGAGVPMLVRNRDMSGLGLVDGVVMGHDDEMMMMKKMEKGRDGDGVTEMQSSKGDDNTTVVDRELEEDKNSAFRDNAKILDGEESVAVGMS